MRCFARWLVFFYILSSVHLGATETPCPPWHTVSREQLTRTEIPQELERILTYHRGNGLFVKFEEEKHVRMLQRPLRSSGALIFLPHKGLYRQLHAPFVQELLITTTALRQRDPSGRVETLELDKVPLAKALVEGFFTVFSGSWDSMQTHFQVYFSFESHHWKLGLKPTQPVMSQMVSCIILTGEKEQVTGLFVEETNGDVTRDQFYAPQILTPEQWRDYQQHFEWRLDTRQ